MAVYLRAAANGIEQKRSLGAVALLATHWYNLRRPLVKAHSAGEHGCYERRSLLPRCQSTSGDGTGRLTRCRGRGAVNLWTVGCADLLS